MAASCSSCEGNIALQVVSLVVKLVSEPEVADSVPEAEKEPVPSINSQQAVPLCSLKALYYARICSYAACLYFA